MLDQLQRAITYKFNSHSIKGLICDASDLIGQQTSAIEDNNNLLENLATRTIYIEAEIERYCNSSRMYSEYLRDGENQTTRDLLIKFGQIKFPQEAEARVLGSVINLLSGSLESAESMIAHLKSYLAYTNQDMEELLSKTITGEIKPLERQAFEIYIENNSYSILNNINPGSIFEAEIKFSTLVPFPQLVSYATELVSIQDIINKVFEDIKDDKDISGFEQNIGGIASESVLNTLVYFHINCVEGDFRAGLAKCKSDTARLLAENQESSRIIEAQEILLKDLEVRLKVQNTPVIALIVNLLSNRRLEDIL